MSIYCTLRRVSMDKIASYQADSALMEADFYSENFSYVQELDIDKSWDGLAYLLTGKSGTQVDDYSIGTAIIGQTVIDKNQDLGYGPARFNNSIEVKSLNEKLKIIDEDFLSVRFDPKRMNELAIYPEIWDDVHAFDYLKEYFFEVQSFYQHASWSNEGIISILS